MKAVIPVAGAGTRLRPLTYTQPKPLIPVAGKAIINFIVDQLVEAGIKEFVFIIGYLGEKIKLHIENEYPDLKCDFVNQESRQGLGHAIWTARKSLIEAEEIFIVLGDTIFDVDFKKMIDLPYSCLGIAKVDDPRKFGVVELNEDGFISKVVEKPKIPRSNLAIVGLYKIKEVNTLIEAIQYNIDNNIRTVGEFQLTDGLMRMLEKGVEMKSSTVNNWFDCGKKEILLETNATLLDKVSFQKNGTNHENSIIIPPVSIGKNCKIMHSIIGPHVAVGDNTTISSSIIKDSIIGNYTSIKDIVLKHSVVGSDAAITGGHQSLNIGDNTEIDLT